MEITRRAFLATSCVATAWITRLQARSNQEVEFPWSDVRKVLQERFSALKRHIIFEYYPWYANDPFRHWQQWGRVPPVDIATNLVPQLGPYDSRSTAVIEQHARWIVESGVGVVDLSWWGRDSFSDTVVSRVMDVMADYDIHVTFHLEPYGLNRVENLLSDVRYLVQEFGEKRNWDCFYLNQRMGGSKGPIFKFFNTTLPEHIEDCHGELQEIPGYFPDSVWRKATDELRLFLEKEFQHVTLLSNTRDAPRARAAGFDGIATYDPAIEPEQYLDFANSASQNDMLFSFNVNPGWDEIVQRNVPEDSCYQERPFLPRTRKLNWSNADDRELARSLSESRILESLQGNLLLQLHPWFGNVDAGFFLFYITSFNEWHEGTAFEPMQNRAEMSTQQQAMEYHNPSDGYYRLRSLQELLAKLL